jgi:short-subunit dehydrogenase
MTQKIAIVTGAGSGIGQAVALDLAKQNYHIILVGRTKPKLEAVNAEIEKFNGKATIAQLDISDQIAVAAFAKKITDEFKHIDVLFNNAGIGGLGTADIATKTLDQIIETNLLGAIYMANVISAIMRTQGYGYIINLSSIWGKFTMSYVGAYAASKYGLVGFSGCLQKQLLGSGVKVTALCPAQVAVGLGAKRSYSDQMIPVDDVVKAVNFLLSTSKNTAITELAIDCDFRLKVEDNGYKPYYENLRLGE